MAVAHLAVLLGAALFALVAIFQLLTTFTAVGLDQFVDNPLAQADRLVSEAFAPQAILKKKAAAGSQYLLGVGKADITG